MLPLAICSRATALLRRDSDKNSFSSLTQRTNGMTTVTTKDGVEIFYKDWVQRMHSRSSFTMAGR